MIANSGMQQLASGLWAPTRYAEDELESGVTLSPAVRAFKNARSTLAGDSILVTPGTGASVATHIVNGKEHQVVMVADDSGHIQGSLPTYFYASPPSVAGANKLHWDIFNATGSGKIMDVRGIWLIPKLDVTATVIVGTRIDTYRTSAVGTGGTAASVDSATVDPAGGNLTKFDEGNATIPAQITARVLPTGGATISRWLFPSFTTSKIEMTVTGTGSWGFLSQYQNLVPMFTYGQKLVVRENTGLLFKQGSVASLGSVAILIAFTLE